MNFNGSFSSLRPLTSSSNLQQHLQGCIDLHGQSIPHGLLFAPGPDECLVCTCVNGAAGLCRTVLCAPPHNCQSLRVGDQCCQWICLDDIHPHGGNNFDATDGQGGGGGLGGSSASDVKLRLVASAVTAVLSIALLFFLIYRLRKKRMQQQQQRRRHRRRSPADDDVVSIDDSSSVTGAGPQQQRSYWHSLAWWKPAAPAGMFEGRPAPPSYDDAVLNGRREVEAAAAAAAAAAEQDCSSMDSYGSEDAPPYSQIHLDPVIPDWYGHLRQQQQQQFQPGVAAASAAVAPVHRYLPTGPAVSTHITPPCGAAFVLPPVPFSYLSQVHLPRQELHQPVMAPAPRNSLDHHLQAAQRQGLAADSIHRDESCVVVSLRRRQAEKRPSGPMVTAAKKDGSSRSCPPPPPPSCATLPSSLRRMRARSREGIVLPPGEERDAVLQRFSLQLSLDASSPSSSSSPEEPDAAATVAAPEVGRRRQHKQARRPRNLSAGGAGGVGRSPSPSVSSCEHN